MTVSFHTVARVGDLQDGDIIAAAPGGVSMIVYRSGDAYYATQRLCLHQGYDLLDGIVDAGFLICPLHGWRYHAHSGVHEYSRETCLRTYAVRVQGDEIQVDPTPFLSDPGEPTT